VNALLAAADPALAKATVLLEPDENAGKGVAVVAADLNGDGFLELVVGSRKEQLLVLEQQTPGNANRYRQKFATVGGGQDLLALLALDLEGDVDVDLVALHRTRGVVVHDNGCCGVGAPTPEPPLEPECSANFQVQLDSERQNHALVSGPWTQRSSRSGLGSFIFTSDGQQAESMFVEFDLTLFPPGVYAVEASYTPADGRSTAVTYQALRNGAVVRTAVVDQTLPPALPPFVALGSLGQLKVDGKTSVKVRVTTTGPSPGNVVADALRLVHCAFLPNEIARYDQGLRFPLPPPPNPCCPMRPLLGRI
jgi:hypothetical protein